MEPTSRRTIALRSIGRPMGAAAAALAILALVAGCASSGPGRLFSGGSDDSTTSGTVSEASFVGTWGTDDPHEPHLVIAADGTVTGSDGCNTLNGAWEFDAEDGTIEFDRMASTMMACEGVDQSLGQLDSASVDGDTLTVYGDDDVELTTLPRTA